MEESTFLCTGFLIKNGCDRGFIKAETASLHVGFLDGMLLSSLELIWGGGATTLSISICGESAGNIHPLNEKEKSGDVRYSMVHNIPKSFWGKRCLRFRSLSKWGILCCGSERGPMPRLDAVSWSPITSRSTVALYSVLSVPQTFHAGLVSCRIRQRKLHAGFHIEYWIQNRLFQKATAVRKSNRCYGWTFRWRSYFIRVFGY